MNYILKPSLEYMCLVKVAAALWNPHHVRDLMKKFPLNVLEYREKWSNIEGIILGRVPQLPLPECLKEKALVFVRAVGREILNWILYHRGSIFLDIGVPNELFWTPQGTIDRTKVAKMLVKDDAINIAARYKLACTYCLEDEIWELWDKIPEDRKDIFKENTLSYVRGHDLVVLWTYAVMIGVAKMECMIGKRFYLYAFECAAECGNRVAVEYFFRKLTSGERKEFLMRTAEDVARLHHIEIRSKEYYSDALVYLLSQMEEEQQVELFKNCPCYVLECFLHWPRQIFFIEMCNRMWNFLPSMGYSVLLEGIARKLRDGCTDFNYQKLFGEMWRQGPKVHRDIIIRQPTFVSYLLSILCEIKDENNIALIFQDAPRTEKKKFICSSSGNGACNNLIKNEAWNLLKFLVQECFSSKEEVMKFEKDFRKWPHDMILRNDFEKGKMKLDRFFVLLDDIMCGFSKRKCVEDDISEPKRFCNDFEFCLF